MTATQANGTASSGGLGEEFTESIVAATGPNANPRLREVMASLIRHVHAFARESQVTMDEFLAGVELLNMAGKMSTEKRNEGQLLWNIIGLEALVDDITFRKAGEASDAATASAILGPFWRQDAPIREFGSSITFNTPPDAMVAYIHGKVTDAKTGKPIAHAMVDVWEASTNGFYDVQDENQVDHNLRGRFLTTAKGEYAYYGLRPTPYPIPYDGAGGKLLQYLDRHPWRPAHIHYIVTAEGYKPLTTQIYDSESKYIEDDTTFAVKGSLIVMFQPRKGDARADWELEYNIALVEENTKGLSDPPLSNPTY